jgi:hypothetical protein
MIRPPRKVLGDAMQSGCRNGRHDSNGEGGRTGAPVRDGPAGAVVPRSPAPSSVILLQGFMDRTILLKILTPQ